MRETYMAVAGVVATDPTVRTLDDGRQVMSFRVASTSRRYDTGTKTWNDGHTLWVKVSCWRELAENAAKCVRKRDRVLAWGRIRTEQWTTQDGGLRSDLSLDAESLGHDLTFGVSVFDRKTRTVSKRTLTDAPAFDPGTGEILGGEPAEAVTAPEPQTIGGFEGDAEVGDGLEGLEGLEAEDEEELVGSA